jgi:hypothetical protein
VASKIKLITPPDAINDGGCNVLLINITMENLTKLINDLWDHDLALNLYLCNNLDDAWLDTVLPKMSKILAYDVAAYSAKLCDHIGFAKYRNYEEILNELST